MGTPLTVQVVVADEDGFILFQEDTTDGMGDPGEDVTTFSNNARVRVGRVHNEDGDNLKNWFGWIHLKNLTIAQGATINSAILSVYHHAHDGFDTGESWWDNELTDPEEGMVVKAEDTDSASKPANYAAVDGWTLTSASATVTSFIDADEYNDPEMGPTGEATESFTSNWYPRSAHSGADPDTDGLEIKTILQELVNRSGWSSGSNVNLKLTPAASTSYDRWIEWKDYDTSTSLAPKLVIDYTAAAAGATATPEAFMLFVD